MNEPLSDSLSLADQLRAALLRGGPLTAAQLQAATGKSQPSISLALAKLGDEVYKLGAARSTRYALAQPILGLSARQPINLAGPNKDQGLFGALTYLSSDLVCTEVNASKDEWLTRATLPWWLSTLRPQGFLGRQFTKVRPDFASDPDQWTLNQVLYIAANHFNDPPGAFSIGVHGGGFVDSDRARSPIPLALRGEAFDAMADAMVDGLPMGSSAGGEQPKFIALVECDSEGEMLGTRVIVKYSPPRGTPFGERWHDLLLLEHLANDVLRSSGITSAQTQLVHTARRTYLQSTRFDRMGLAGKRHAVAASAVHDEFVKAPRRHWVATAQALVAQKLLATEHLVDVARTYLFGQFIANTDMHFGNLSFFVDDVTRPVFVPTPVYDMLPMKWRPSIHDGSLDITPVQAQMPLAGFEAQTAWAKACAVRYWERAAGLPDLSPELRMACTQSAQRLQTNFLQ
jgi:hypothetical protein